MRSIICERIQECSKEACKDDFNDMYFNVYMDKKGKDEGLQAI